MLWAIFLWFLAFCEKVVKSKMADPLYDKDHDETSLGCVMKSPGLLVSYDLNTPRATGCWPQKPFPHRSKKTPLKKSISPVWVRSKSICEPVTSDATN